MPKTRTLIFLLINLVSSFVFANETKVKIGVIAPLTGEMATIGHALKNGIELARIENPQSFQNIEFLYEDDQYDSKQSISAYRKLKDLNNVDLIFGFGIRLGSALAPIAEQEHTLLVNFSFEATPVIGKTYVIRSMNSTQHYMEVFAKHMKENDKKTFSYIRTEISFFSAMANDLKKALGPKYSVTELAVVNPEDNDFKTILLKLKSKQNTEVGLFLLPDQILSFINQAKAFGLKFNYFGTDLFETAAGISNSEKLLDGSLYPDNEVSPDFRKKYRSRFGNESQMTFAGNGYDITLLFANLLNKQNTYDPLDLIGSLPSVSKSNGVLGEFSFKSNAETGMYFDFPIFVKEISGSNSKVVK